jgi:hypothetical protein
MRILFAGHFEWNCGSTQVVKEYVDAGNRLGIEICLSDVGPIDRVTAKQLPVVDTLRDTDILVFVLEGDQFINRYRLQRCQKKVPRRHRIVIDADGHNRELTREGSDANHRNTEEFFAWREIFSELSDTVLEPSAVATDVRAQFLYFGMSHQLTHVSYSQPEWDLGYIGNNWYRWKDVVWLLQEIKEVRHLIPRVAIRGMWWDQERLCGFPGAEEATFSDPILLSEHDVQLGPSVEFGSVVTSMSKACVHPILARPVLRHMHLVTPRMFETFASDAIPVLAPNLDYTTALYGDDCRPLILNDKPAEQLVEMITEPQSFRDLSLHIRAKLRREHSYEKRIVELLHFVE